MDNNTNRKYPVRLWMPEFTNCKIWKNSVVLISFLALLLQIFTIADNWKFYQYDFRAYYSGAYLYLNNQDPYSMKAHLEWTASLGLHDHRLRFVYSPILLNVFIPLALLSYPVAYTFWLVLQIIALVCVFFLGVRALNVPSYWIAPCLAFGLNGTCAAVLRSGQVTLIILACLLAFVLLLQRGRLNFALFISFVASTLKIWVMPIIVIAAFPLSWRRITLVITCLAVIVAVAAAGKVFYPELQDQHEAIVGSMISFKSAPASPYDQSIRNILAYFEEAGIFYPGWRVAIWSAITFLILATSALVCMRLSQTGIEEKELYRLLFVISCLGILLIVPRAIHYQWTIAVPATAFCLSRIRIRWLQAGLAIAVMLPTLYINRYIFGISTDSRVEGLFLVPWGFWSYIVILTLWIVALVISINTARGARPLS